MNKAITKKVFVMFLFAFLFVGSTLPKVREFKEAKADVWSEKVNLRSMITSYAQVLSADSTADDVTATSGKYSYFIRHGYLGTSTMAKFDNVTYVSSLNASYNSGDDNKARIVSGWQIYTQANGQPIDSVICGMVAHEKMYFSADYVLLGGWPTNASFNWYVQRNGETSYELIKTVKFPSAAESSNYSGLNRIVLENGDSVYWEFYYQYGGRNIQVTNSSQSFPVFNFTEYYEIPTDTLDAETMVTAINTNPVSTSPNGVISYTTKNSSILDADYGTATEGDLGSNTGDYYFSPSNIILKNGQKATLQVTAIEPAYLQLQLTDGQKTTCEGLSLNGYLHSTSTGKTKQIYSTTYGEHFDKNVPQGNIILEAGDILYIEYSSASTSNIDTDMLPKLVVTLAVGDLPENDFPKYNPRDYSTLQTIDYVTVLKESARLKCQPASTKDFDIVLTTGKVGTGGEASYPFTFINYNDGQYIDAPTQAETASMYVGQNSFDAKSGSGAESYRICFSKSNYVIFKIVATKDTHVTVSHDAITGGWINGNSLYVWGFQKIKTKVVQANEIHIPQQTLSTDPISANALGMEFNLKKGDIGYYAFGTTEALNANLNVTPSFTSDPSLYDEEARDGLYYDFVSINKKYHDLVSDGVASKGELLEYGLISVLMGHGEPENIQKMDVFTGTGNNDATDSMSTGLASSNPPLFQRWQMRCGKDDDAIIKFIAGADTRLHITWRKEAEITSWATHTALKSYAIDTDGFLMLDQAKLCVNEGHGQLEDTYYDYDVQLKEGQAFIICYTSMGANYGVIQYDFGVEAVAAEYDATKLFDFTAAKELRNYYNVKVEDLRTIVDGLNAEDYSIVNWAYIDEALTKFISLAKEATSKEKIDELYEEAKARIDSIPTIAQEAQALANAKQEAKDEVKEYLKSKKMHMSSKHYKEASALYDAFCVTVDKTTTVSKINIEVIRIKAQIDNLCDVNWLPIIIIASVGGTLLIGGGVALALILINKKKKGKIVE